MINAQDLVIMLLVYEAPPLASVPLVEFSVYVCAYAGRTQGARIDDFVGGPILVVSVPAQRDVPHPLLMLLAKYNPMDPRCSR